MKTRAENMREDPFRVGLPEAVAKTLMVRGRN
jgi:hypothetical protein